MLRGARAYVVVSLGFALSQALYFNAGVRFDDSPLTFFAQLLDLPLLQHHLAQSLLYLHAQPPLFNALTGVALKLSPTDPSAVLSFVFHGVGWLAALAMLDLLVGLRVPRWLACVVAIAVPATPQFVLFENHYFYPHLNACLVIVAAACLLRAGGQANRWMSAGAWALAALVLTRSFFHPAFLIAVALGSVLMARPRRAVLRRFAGPLVVVGVFVLKNVVLFGFVGLSSWSGNSFHRGTRAYLGDARVNAEIAAGTITRLSEYREFSSGDVYMQVLGLTPLSGDRGVPAVDQTAKTVPSQNPVNYNHWTYPLTSKQYARNALTLIRHYPVEYARAVWSQGWDLFFKHATAGDFMERNLAVLPSAYRIACEVELSSVTYWLLALGLLFAAFSARGDVARRYFMAFAFGTFAYVLLVGLPAEFGENYRFRYKVLWLAVIVAVAGWVWLLRRLAALRQNAAGPASSTHERLKERTTRPVT